MRTRYDVAIRQADDDRILLLGEGRLPGFTLDAAPPWQVVTTIGTEIRDRFGLEIVTLRAASLDEARPGQADERRLYEAEWLGGRKPAGASWVLVTDLDEPDAERLRPVSGDRQPWYRPGWFATMTTWIDDRLADAGIRRRGPVTQVRSWGRAALLMLETDRGRLWAKDVPSVFAHEVAVSELLADIDPGVVPPVVAADRALARIITEHVEGPALDSIDREPAVWSATLSRLGELQRVLAADLGPLEVAGTAGVRLSVLADRLPTILADDELLLVDRAGGLTRSEATRIRERVPTLATACRALDASGVPLSLEHGDLSPGQVIIGEMGPVFLDWSDGSITHPFLSAASLLAGRVSAGDGGEDGSVEAYLGPWLAGGFGLDERGGREAFALARTVLPLHLAALHAERVRPGLEQPWEMERVVPTALRAILRR